MLVLSRAQALVKGSIAVCGKLARTVAKIYCVAVTGWPVSSNPRAERNGKRGLASFWSCTKTLPGYTALVGQTALHLNTRARYRPRDPNALNPLRLLPMRESFGRDRSEITGHICRELSFITKKLLKTGDILPRSAVRKTAAKQIANAGQWLVIRLES